MPGTKIERHTDDDDEPPLCAELRLVFVAPSTIVSSPPFRLVHKGQLTIGRKPTCDIHIDSGGVSEDHATVYSLEKEDSWEVVLTDCGSTNGTTVNGTRIKSQQLNDGDIVGIGSSFLVFREHRSPDTDCSIPSIIGCSPEIRHIRRQIEIFAPTMLTVLLQGESGVGKEVVASALHSMSGRKGPHVPYNCAGLASLGASTLFGHKKGAFTDAHSDHDGLFAQASVKGGGTLFLDEIAELSMDVQPTLLRALDNRTYRPVKGAIDQISLARVITGTKTALREAVEKGLFRDDLFFRIQTIVLNIPPLRERREDILLLAAHFLADSQKTLSSNLARELLLHPWPGNVRELKQTLEKAVTIAKESGKPEVRVSHCREKMEESAKTWQKQFGTSGVSQIPARTQDAPAMAKQKGRPAKEELLEVLERCDWKILRAAQALDVDRKTIRRWIEYYELTPATPEE
jgi:transcriptional regulator with GAF, ATPase, and Fis domain